MFPLDSTPSKEKKKNKSKNRGIKYTINKFDITGAYRVLHPLNKECILFSKVREYLLKLINKWYITTIKILNIQKHTDFTAVLFSLNKTGYN